MADAVRPPDTALGARREPVQQQSTATVEFAPERGELHQTADVRMKPHPTLLPTVHTEKVKGDPLKLRFPGPAE